MTAWRDAREGAWTAFDQGKTKEARANLTVFAQVWPHARAAKRVDAVIQEIDREERLRAELVSTHEGDLAQKLEDANAVPDALAHWQAAFDAEKDAERKASFGAARDRCLGLIADADAARDRARELRQRGELQQASELLAVAVRRSPWLSARSDFTIPCRIETIPPGLRVLVDGHELANDTPATIDRPAVPGELIVNGKHGERIVRDLPPVPGWPIFVGFPREATWARRDVQAVAAPALPDGRLIAAGSDRAVTCVKRDTGEVVWRRPLGVFGDVAATPALLADGKGGRLAVVRTVDGTVIALDEAKGTERWRASVARPPSVAPRPIAAPSGVVVRDGARAVALLRASDG